ncbi:leucine-rich repeat-containing G-protein coupled receptor 5-like isoform X2 [Centruroides vittatus]|uniref:leucine-rich repeat-containing G-protein coupled receptor 5-like isoform X2 n=1 Tax=Centruroides vittatus TaxID=120091 RepID=UPI00350FA4CF
MAVQISRFVVIMDCRDIVKTSHSEFKWILMFIIVVRTCAEQGEIPCTLKCKCEEQEDSFQVDCSNQSLTKVPAGLSPSTISLNLQSNNITILPDFVFQHLSKLKDLNLADNQLSNLSREVFFGLDKIRTLHLEENQLTFVPAGSFRGLKKLQKLWLHRNMLTEVPSESLGELTELEALNLANNEISNIPNFTFRNMSNLVILILQDNKIQTIGPHGFDGLSSLKVLDIKNNRLRQFPSAISTLSSLRELSFANNGINYLPNHIFQGCPKLTLLEMGKNPISEIGVYTFYNMAYLKKLILSEVRKMEEFPDLKGTSALEHLRLDRASLKTVPEDLCRKVPMLKSLNLKSNKLKSLPRLSGCKELRFIDLSYNLIDSLGETPFSKLGKLIDLFLSNNLIERIESDSFEGLDNLQVLDLHNNRIEFIHPEAFSSFNDLRDLNLAYNQFSVIPTSGLENLRQLKTFNNRNLKEFPAPEMFPKIHTLALSYAYHCCPFLPYARKPTASLKETIVWLTREELDMKVWSTNITDVWPGYENFSSKFEEFATQLWSAFRKDYTIPDNLATQYVEEYPDDSFEDESGQLGRYPIQCLPEPGPFMPCEDLFGWWTLRCGIWVVFLLAMLGNGLVVIVLLFGRSKMDVPRFLVCNLAIADFMMGIYLGILAVVDASTLGEFKIYAVYWQTSAGCQIAGFLGVISSELSVFTLAVITLERNYAITNAMHLNKRLSLKHAGYIMASGWFFALVMAILPMLGISDYRKFAICLPFETEDVFSLSYVVFLILINGVAFLILMGCYFKMYWVIRGSQAWNSNDSRIAKRMALLVFTDFICWAPIAFFSLTAVFGVHLISLEEAKVFTIFVLPLNSCANPFLYAIFTKQFKKDCVLICKRIEESRVTRGIGRCRHSSNFSNRHTPANTNSAADRKSGEQPVCQCAVGRRTTEVPSGIRSRSRSSWLKYLFCNQSNDDERSGSDYTYAIAQIQRNLEGDHHKRTSSISSENFSSRSDSWRYGIALRLLERNGRRNSWSNNTQKSSSQDSHTSCSRQDSSTSTFRLSRSSVSSDTSSSLAGRTAYTRDRPPPARAVVNGETSQRMLSFRSSVKDKPKLCRQTAVHDLNGGKTYDSGQRSPPSTARMYGNLCPTCARKEPGPSLVFKNKELEEKFTCFYNRLVETSNEDSSEATTSKEEQVIFSSDQSTEPKPEKDDIELEKVTSDNPQIPVDITATIIESQASEILDEFPNNDTLKTPDIMENNRLHVSAENSPNPKSRSLTFIGFVPRRKATSDTSLKKVSLRSLPTMFSSLSSHKLIERSDHAKVRSHGQIATQPRSIDYIPSSRSEQLLPQLSLDWFSPRNQHIAEDTESEDECIESKQLKTQEICDPRLIKHYTVINASEDVPLIDEDGQKPVSGM